MLATIEKTMPQTKSKLLWLDEDLDRLVKKAKSVSNLNESDIYRLGARMLAEQLIEEDLEQKRKKAEDG
jgi:hypothetical protein